MDRQAGRRQAGRQIDRYSHIQHLKQQVPQNRNSGSITSPFSARHESSANHTAKTIRKNGQEKQGQEFISPFSDMSQISQKALSSGSVVPNFLIIHKKNIKDRKNL